MTVYRRSLSILLPITVLKHEKSVLAMINKM